jgi:preprotein translocase subunit SecG
MDVLRTILIIVSILLISIVLLQSNKASDASQIITGGNRELLANRKERGSEKFISRFTYTLGILFILISLILSF